MTRTCTGDLKSIGAVLGESQSIASALGAVLGESQSIASALGAVLGESQSIASALEVGHRSVYLKRATLGRRSHKLVDLERDRQRLCY
jgi:hypothetical protein